MHDPSKHRTDISPKYRICMVSDFFYPNMGGVEMHIWCLSQCLIHRGHKVIIITHAYDGRQGIRYMTNGLKVYYLPLTVCYDQVIFPTLFSFLPLFRNILIRERIQIIHGHQSVSSLANECILYARTMGYHCCFTDHSLFGFGDMISIHINKLLQSSLSDIDHVICVSNACRENLVLRARLHPSFVSTIPNAVDCKKFTPGPSPHFISSTAAVTATNGPPLVPAPEAAMSTNPASTGSHGPSSAPKTHHTHHSSLGPPIIPMTIPEEEKEEGETITGVPNIINPMLIRDKHHFSGSSSNTTINIIVLSRLVYRKGIDLLVKVIPIICSMNHQVKFIIGGNGPKLLLLEEMREKYSLHDRIELLGEVPHHQVRNILIRGHIFLNCSLTESFCIALLEAASCGLFVVSTKVGGVPEVLPSSMIKFADVNSNSLTEALLEAIAIAPSIDPWEFHERMKSMFNWLDVSKRTEKIYCKIIEMRKPSFIHRLYRYQTIGPFSGIAMCCIITFLYLYWKIIEVIWPKEDIEIAPDIVLDNEHAYRMKGGGSSSGTGRATGNNNSSSTGGSGHYNKQHQYSSSDLNS